MILARLAVVSVIEAIDEGAAGCGARWASQKHAGTMVAKETL
jgi:hypothetical protein